MVLIIYMQHGHVSVKPWWQWPFTIYTAYLCGLMINLPSFWTLLQYLSSQNTCWNSNDCTPSYDGSLSNSFIWDHTPQCLLISFLQKFLNRQFLKWLPHYLNPQSNKKTRQDCLVSFANPLQPVFNSCAIENTLFGKQLFWWLALCIMLY